MNGYVDFSPSPTSPVMAFMLPSYPFPPATPNLPQAFFPSQPHFPAHPTLASEITPASQAEFPSRTSMLRQPCACPVTPPAGTVALGRASPPLFQSRGSSPLQLNLLQLEEAPESSTGAAGTLGTTGTAASGLDCTSGASRDRQPKAPPTCSEPSDTQNSDAISTSSDLLNLLLSEDLCSATGSALSRSGTSATSDSLGSSSLGCDTSRSGAGSSDTSHTSKYFGSIDSSENNHKAKMITDTEESEQFIKDLQAVLKEDQEKLKLLQRSQPHFTEGQRRELREVHPWVHTGGLPTAIDVTGCVYCESEEKGNLCLPYEEDSPSLGLCDTSEAKEEESGQLANPRKEAQT